MNANIQEKYRYIIYAILLIAFSIVNITENGTISVLVWVLMIIWVLFNGNSNDSYLIYFLIPNLNILNVSDAIPSPINLLMMLIGLKYLLTRQGGGKRARKLVFYGKINDKILISGMVILLIEIMHFACYKSVATLLFNALNMAIDTIFFIYFFTDGDEQAWSINTEALSFGIIISFIVNIVAAPNLISYIFASNYRLEAYANDPNYYSMYIIIALIAIFRKVEKGVGKKYINYSLILILSLLGLLTSSKMCILCLAVIYLIFFISSFNLKYGKRYRFLFVIVPIAVVAISTMWEKISLLINKVFLRFFLQADSLNFNAITSGRSEIVQDYLQKLDSDMGLLLFGKGIDYNIYFSNNGDIINVVHNTYMDILLSWGILGTIVFLIIIYIILKNRIKIKGKTIFDLLGIIMFMAMLFALSCFSADMFWFLLALNLIPLKKIRDQQYEK